MNDMISLQQKLETSKSFHDEDKLAFLPLLKKKKKRVHKQKKEKKIIKLAQTTSSFSNELAELQNKQGDNLHQHYFLSKPKHKLDLI